MSGPILALVALVASTLGAIMAVPQALRLRRLRHFAGVSPAWAGMSTAVNAGWIAYGIGVADWGIVPVSVISVIAYTSIIVTMMSVAGTSRRSVLVPVVGAAVAVLVVPAAVGLIGGWSAAGVTLGLAYGVQLSPAVLSVYRSDDVSAVSPATWVVSVAEAALWGVYGLGRGDVGLLALAVTGSSMSTLVLVRLAWQQRGRLRIRLRRGSLPRPARSLSPA